MTIKSAHAISTKEVMQLLSSSINGLSSNQVAEKLIRYGANNLPAPRFKSFISMVLGQFLNPFIYLLLIAAFISVFLNELLNSYFILFVLIINAIIGAYQEYSAQKTALALRNLVPAMCSVIRDNKQQVIHASQVVPGDIIVICTGDKVPADARLIEDNSLIVDESLLTGESIPIQKNHEAEVLENSTLSDRFNMLYAGTVVTKGSGRAIVVSTGPSTVVGSIAYSVLKEQNDIPLMKTINIFTLRITIAVTIIIACIFLLSILKGESIFDFLLLSVALAVCIIPESLPAAVTVALAVGMKRLAEVKVVVRKLIAVEALGSCNIIASDKTGTITINELTIQEILMSDGSKYKVEGLGLDPLGAIKAVNGKGNSQLLEHLCYNGALTCESKLTYENSVWKAHGDMVDIAFLVLAKKIDHDIEHKIQSFSLIERLSYESESGFGASIHLIDGRNILYVKGSPEKIIAMSVEKHNESLHSEAELMASAGYKVIATAYKVLSTAELNKPILKLLDNMRLISIVGLIDPIRKGVVNAVAMCKSANVNVLILTGDHPATAGRIAADIGIMNEKQKIVTGPQFMSALKIGPNAVDTLVSESSVFARIEPQQKLEIVKSLMRMGNCVAVTGDGANDAPALKQANVGVAMGLRGTDIARESADIILIDDNFSSIVNGIEQGRVVYANIRKAIFMLISTGVGELILFLLSMFFGLPIPLTPVQLLWLNLVTGGLQEVALAFEPKSGQEMLQKPRKLDEPIFNSRMIHRVLLAGTSIGILGFTLFYWAISHQYNLEMARNITLLCMVIFEGIEALNGKSEFRSIFQQPLFNNKFLIYGIIIAQAAHILAMHTPVLSDILQLSPVSIKTWLTLMLMATFLLFVDEIYKLLNKRV